MKTTLKTFYIPLVLFFFSFRLTAQSSSVMYDPGNLSGSLELNPNDYIDDAYYEWEINTNSNKPLKITYMTASEGDHDVLYIYAKDDAGNLTYVTSASGYQSGTILTMIPSGKAQIIFVTDDENNYFNNSDLTGFSLSFCQDDSYIMSGNMGVNGNAYINGNLGVGVGNPLEKLHVNGAVRGAWAGGALEVKTNYGSIYIGPQNGADWAHFYTNKSKFIFNKPVYAITGELSSYDGINLSLQTYGTTRMTILSNNGNVGIGTIAPGQALDVEKNADYQIRVGNNAGQGYNIGRNGATGYLTFYGDQSGYNGYTFGGVNGTRMTINGNGKVGIGTNSPNNLFEVVGSNSNTLEASGFYNTYTYGNSDRAETRINIGKIEGSIRQPMGAIGAFPLSNYDSNYGNLVFYTRNSQNMVERVRIDNNGNVGIGTPAPASKLDVNGEITMPFDSRIGSLLSDAFSSVYTDNRAMGHYSLGWFSDSWCPGGGTLWVSGYGGMKFFTSGSPRLVVDISGKVGIGTTTPDHELTVNGTIHAKEVIVTVDIPADYVFKPSYKLMPLTQVEQYVKTNSHLPEIPSASEVSKNGMNMGEMQNKLLQKVEELTLYMIEQQKTINQQSAKIEELEKKLK